MHYQDEIGSGMDGEQDASSRFIGEEYALSGGSRNFIRDAIMNDLKRTNPTTMEFAHKSMKARRQSCVYLVDNFKPIVESYLDKINDWSFDVLEMREKNVTENPLVVITMASMAVCVICNQSINYYFPSFAF